MEGTSLIQARRMQNYAGYTLALLIGELAAAGWRALMRGVEAVAAAQRSARARSELHNLSDHFLKDIGIDRRQIDRMFR